jgi:hypothetical protein
MQLREQPPVLAQLSTELRADAENEAAAIFARRLRIGIAIYPLIAVVLWSGTDYRHSHFTALLSLTLLFVFGVAHRLYVVSARERICSNSPEHWYRLVAVSVVVLSGSFGFMLQHAMANYSLGNWNFVIISDLEYRSYIRFRRVIRSK